MLCGRKDRHDLPRRCGEPAGALKHATVVLSTHLLRGLAQDRRAPRHTTTRVHLGIARRAIPLDSSALSATIVVVSVRFKPSEPPQPPRLDHVRDLWQMHRPQRPQPILTATPSSLAPAVRFCAARPVRPCHTAALHLDVSSPLTVRHGK